MTLRDNVFTILLVLDLAISGVREVISGRYVNFAATAVFLCTLLHPTDALAHFVAGGSGFSTGFFHPVLGPDHLLAMISVGIISAQMGGRAVWAVPATFVSVMAVGGSLGAVGAPLPLIEYGIVISVIALGAAIASGKKMPPKIAYGFVGLFAIFHGYAHGMEMPIIAEPLFYAAGFMLSTACLHLIGVAIGFAAVYTRAGAFALRNCGAAICAFGFYLILAN